MVLLLKFKQTTVHCAQFLKLVLTILVLNRYVSLVFGLAILAGVVVFIVVDSDGETERLISLGGVGVLLFFGFVCSAHPGAVR